MDPRASGSLDLRYAQQRGTSRALKYRLARRTQEVLDALQRSRSSSPGTILDLGTADGRMLEKLRENHPSARCIGVEYDGGLAVFARTHFPKLHIVQGDVQALPFQDMSVDTVIATAVIEHLPNPEKLLEEARRVLKPEGLLVLTAPDPFWERIASWVGHLPAEAHHHVMGLSELQDLATSRGFRALEARKFMLSPIGMPAEALIEGTLRNLGLGFLLANQLLVLKR